MNNLSQECIEQIEKAATRKKSIWHYQPFINGAMEALTNPVIFQSAGLMTVEEAKKMATQEYWRGWKDYGESL